MAWHLSESKYLYGVREVEKSNWMKSHGHFLVGVGVGAGEFF